MVSTCGWNSDVILLACAAVLLLHCQVFCFQTQVTTPRKSSGETTASCNPPGAVATPPGVEASLRGSYCPLTRREKFILLQGGRGRRSATHLPAVFSGTGSFFFLFPRAAANRKFAGTLPLNNAPPSPSDVQREVEGVEGCPPPPPPYPLRAEPVCSGWIRHPGPLKSYSDVYRGASRVIQASPAESPAFQQSSSRRLRSARLHYSLYRTSAEFSGKEKRGQIQEALKVEVNRLPTEHCTRLYNSGAVLHNQLLYFNLKAPVYNWRSICFAVDFEIQGFLRQFVIKYTQQDQNTARQFISSACRGGYALAARGSVVLIAPALLGLRRREKFQAGGGSLNTEVLRTDEGEVRNARAGVNGRSTRKPRQPAASSGTIPTRENMGANPPGNRTRFSYLGGERLHISTGWRLMQEGHSSWSWRRLSIRRALTNDDAVRQTSRCLWPDPGYCRLSPLRGPSLWQALNTLLAHALTLCFRLRHTSNVASVMPELRFLFEHWATMAEWLACSPTTKAIRAQFRPEKVAARAKHRLSLDRVDLELEFQHVDLEFDGERRTSITKVVQVPPRSTRSRYDNQTPSAGCPDTFHRQAENAIHPLQRLRVRGQEARERYGRQLHARLAPHRSYAQGVQCFRRHTLIDTEVAEGERRPVPEVQRQRDVVGRLRLEESGEEAMLHRSGDTLYSGVKFGSLPLLEIRGYVTFMKKYAHAHVKGSNPGARVENIGVRGGSGETTGILESASVASDGKEVDCYVLPREYGEENLLSFLLRTVLVKRSLSLSSLVSEDGGCVEFRVGLRRTWTLFSSVSSGIRRFTAARDPYDSKTINNVSTAPQAYLADFPRGDSDDFTTQFVCFCRVCTHLTPLEGFCIFGRAAVELKRSIGEGRNLVLRADEGNRAEYRAENEGVGETVDPRENPPTNGIQQLVASWTRDKSTMIVKMSALFTAGRRIVSYPGQSKIATPEMGRGEQGGKNGEEKGRGSEPSKEFPTAQKYTLNSSRWETTGSENQWKTTDCFSDEIPLIELVPSDYRADLMMEPEGGHRNSTTTCNKLRNEFVLRNRRTTGRSRYIMGIFLSKGIAIFVIQILLSEECPVHLLSLISDGVFGLLGKGRGGGGAEKRGSYKGDTSTRYNSAIAPTHRVLNWRAVFS
ncbi:hypothetical protein PR048_000134 [Dryococelus australis]|uniref:Uncharacterized protein n=1 Tax=Dryococelus australis TaxID=614101 RepID=A0ABQ9IDT8_9NEOP|nr:hypothetical protein PR048_000134 [Dryococelus australis]